MKRKILLVLHTPPPFGGGEIQAQNLKKYFANQIDYSIYDYSRKSLTRKKQGRFNLLNVSFGFYWIMQTAFLLIKIRPGKIYFTLPKGYYAFLRNGVIILLSRILKVKILGELPGTSFLFLENKRSFKYKSGIFLLRQVNDIRYLSKSIATIHQKYCFNKAVVIDNGVWVPPDIRADSSVFKESTLKLIYIGSITFSKGIFNSIQVLKLCKDNGISIHFNVVGEWEKKGEKRQAEEFIVKNKISDMITFHGQIIGRHKWEVFSKNAILLHPTYWDGVPLSILEAFGLGLCVISTRVGGIPDVITDGNNGILLNENDPKSIFKAISLLYFDRDKMICISKLNKELYASRFGLNLFLENMKTWFEKED